MGIERYRAIVRLEEIRSLTETGEFEAAKEIGSTSEDKLTITVSRADLDRHLLQNRTQYRKQYCCKYIEEENN